MIGRVFALLLCVLLGRVDAAEPSLRLEIVEREEYYVVHGNSAEALQRQMSQRREPHAQFGWHGLTTAGIDTRIELHTFEDGCGFAWLDVRVELVTWLPQWRAPQDVELGLRERWDAMLAGLRRHEEGHRRHVHDAGRALYTRLTTLPRQPDCRSFERRVRGQIERELARLRMKSETYDAITGGGRRQGAVL